MSLYRSFTTVGGLTLVSRILGFVRDILFAAVFGSGMVADAFNVAFRFPNLFRRLFGEGAFNSAFIPLFAKALEGEGRGVARQFAEEAMAGLILIVGLVSVVCMVGMPYLMFLLAPGFSANPPKFDLAVLLTQITFPYLLCMSLVALLSGVLNTFARFVESASVSIILNLTLAAGLLAGFALGFGNDRGGGILQAAAVTVAGLLQLTLLAWGMHRIGFALALRWPRWTPGMRRLVTLGVPGVVAGGVTQLNIMIGTMIASLEPGAVSQLYYADRLYELPLAIVGIAVGVVLLPDLSRQLKAGDEIAAMDSQNRSAELSMLLTVPAAMALAVVPLPIVSVLFERGAFTAADSQSTAAALAFFALGLPSFVLIKVFSPAYFAREDTKTPMRYAGISLTANTLLSLALFFLFRRLGMKPQLGIALATTLGGWLNTALLVRTLIRRGHFVADARLLRTLPRILFSSVTMAAMLYIGAELLGPILLGGASLWQRAFALGVLLSAGFIAYSVAVLGSGALEIRQLRRLMGR